MKGQTVWAQRGQIDVNDKERFEDKGDDDMDDIHESQASQHANYCGECLYVPEQDSRYYLKRQKK